MGIVVILFAAWVAWQTGKIPERLVSNEPGPKFFPYLSAGGMALFAVLTMIFDAPKDAETQKPYLTKDGWKRLAVILIEALLFVICMNYIGFLITAAIGMFVFIWTLKGDKKINVVFAIILSIGIACAGYFGFTRGFVIPLPKGLLWEMLGIPMP